ncbi:lysis system i-spanin subunit Rz [Pseudomonas sp. KU43P]|uniref:lysis system i-spanin subunit Rz n=1 Tax=Pseudomonas sp. KU43P TaxID=2487887 RepID=UPI0012A9E87E|nr:lysis system i-spanin subunit Rz [Pseudomonas sp. KU43P]BBH44756.1 lysis protein [Pseudomonas sp. KU43P]
MKALDWRLACLALLLGLALGGRGAWLWQACTYGKQLAEQAADYGRQLAAKDRDHGREREQAAAAALDQMAEQQGARRALEGRLQEQNQTHWKEMADAKKTRDRLRDQLATADVRLSVLVDAGAFASQSCDGEVRETTSPGGVVHGIIRADVDHAFAQRILAITQEGDRGLIALKACQAYVSEIIK